MDPATHREGDSERDWGGGRRGAHVRNEASGGVI